MLLVAEWHARWNDDFYHHLNDSQGLDELRRPLALFRSLSQSRAREKALRFGSFIFLPFNTTMSSSTLNATATPPLAFLRSWGCVHFLVVFNLGPEPHAVDREWALSLPESGVFVISTGLDRLGPVSLQSLKLQPHEAIVIKLFHTDSSSWDVHVKGLGLVIKWIYRLTGIIGGLKYYSIYNNKSI